MSDDSPTFPFVVNVNGGGVGVQIELHADGTWSGDLVVLKQVMKDSKGAWGDQGMLLWLLMRQMMRDDERFW